MYDTEDICTKSNTKTYFIMQVPTHGILNVIQRNICLWNQDYINSLTHNPAKIIHVPESSSCQITERATEVSASPNAWQRTLGKHLEAKCMTTKEFIISLIVISVTPACQFELKWGKEEPEYRLCKLQPQVFTKYSTRNDKFSLQVNFICHLV